MKIRSLLSVLVVSVMVMVMSWPVMAQEKMFIMPYSDDSSWFIYDVDPGDEFKDIVTITNKSEYEQTVQLMAVDAEATATGSFALKPPDKEQANIGDWVTVEDSVVTLEPGEKKHFQFTVSVPGSVPPGDYAGGLILLPYEDDEEVDTGGAGIKTVVSVGVRMYITVSGEVNFNFLWDEYQHSVNDDSEHIFDLTFSNNGNVAAESSGLIKLDSALFDDVEIPLSTGIIYSADSMSPVVAWTNPFPFGPVKATTVVDYSRSNVMGALSEDALAQWSGSYEESLSFWIIPYREMLLALLIFVVTFGVMFVRIQQVEKFKKQCAPYCSPIDENLTVIAGRLGVSWKKIAKLNKLKFPYMVARGQTILAPQGPAATPQSTVAPQAPVVTPAPQVAVQPAVVAPVPPVQPAAPVAQKPTPAPVAPVSNPQPPTNENPPLAS
ncbi:DUF916 domain-containing protein [Candidatus Peregrinibacteria bacterium]|jgi:hypothetical protein|nr:DUF916 domain-containing protein [Candidatus Peregrinibacteria bacterium]MBT7483417.1 DUF916 domain-containing protein [Candidatus Peregrinibacteria bacterium]MBT7702823.1 DUF916 domain-containing protein [Candidatus Peregrinibacteria bacterium]